jgi:trigger factor
VTGCSSSSSTPSSSRCPRRRCRPRRYLEAQGKSREEFEGELRESAEKSVRAQFILDAAADKAEVQIGDSELTEYLVRQAARYDMAPQEFANQVMQSGNLPALVADVRRNKALAELLQSATITDASGNPVDLDALSAAAEPQVDEGEVVDEIAEDE